MKRRDFLQWLAATSGVVVVDPIHARASAPQSPDNEVWFWLSPNAALHAMTFDVVPDRDTVVVIASRASDPAAMTHLVGMKSFVDLGEVLVEGVTDDRGRNLVAFGFDLALFDTPDVYCPLDWGVVTCRTHARMRVSRLRPYSHQVTLAMATRTFARDGSCRDGLGPWDLGLQSERPKLECLTLEEMTIIEAGGRIG